MQALISNDDYNTRVPQWQKVRDVLSGHDAVKQRGTVHLPMLTSQSENNGDGYADYKMRAEFFEAGRPTQQGFVGTIMRIPAAIEGVPDTVIADDLNSIGRKGESLEHVTAEVLRELTGVGRCAILVDKIADASAADVPPYLAVIKAESVVHWEEGVRNGIRVPVMIAIQEDYRVTKDNDPLGIRTDTKQQLRVLRLGFPDDETVAMAATDAFAGYEGEDIEAGSAFAGRPTDAEVYWQEIWRETDKKTRQASGGDVTSGHERVAVIVPTKNGGRFWEEIPCDVVNAQSGICLETEEPQMLALANILLGWYRNSADLENGAHLTGVPQAVITGFHVKDGESLYVGQGNAWVSEETGASAFYLEFSGAGLGTIREMMVDKEKRAAVVAGRMLETQPTEAETFGAVKLRRAGERSALGTIADNASEALTRALRRWLQWVSTNYDGDAAKAVTFTLSNDFDASMVEPGRITEWLSMLQSGAMSWETFAYNMRRAELYPEGVSDEEERERIQAGAPGRSRDQEMLVLQSDVRENRISRQTYIERMADLGIYASVSYDAEADRMAEEALDAANRAFQARASMILSSRPDATGATPPGQPGPNPLPTPGDDEEDDELEDDDEAESGRGE